jgi:hypothetical protein
MFAEGSWIGVQTVKFRFEKGTLVKFEVNFKENFDTVNTFRAILNFY